MQSATPQQRSLTSYAISSIRFLAGTIAYIVKSDRYHIQSRRVSLSSPVYPPDGSIAVEARIDYMW